MRQKTNEKSVKGQLSRLSTERVSLGTVSLDKLSTRKILTVINDEDSRVPSTVRKEIPRIDAAVNIIVQQLRLHGRLIYVGAGTSGRLGVLDAAELIPTYSAGPELVRAVIAGGREAMFKPVEGAEDSGEDAKRQLKSLGFSKKDVLVGISASGRTPYVLEALKYARSLRARTIALTVNKNSIIKRVADVSICPDTGPEVVAGSTRMKAGTAQKLVLNMISTTVMIKLGRVHGNLMVNLRPVSQKLRERQKRILMKEAGVSYETAERKLTEAKMDLKLAIIMTKLDMSYDESRNLLRKAHGSLDVALR